MTAMMNYETLNKKFWRYQSQAERVSKGYFPTDVAYNKDANAVLIEARRSRAGDFAISECALTKAARLFKHGDIDDAVLRLVERNGNYVAHISLEVMMRKLRNVPSLEGRYGNYWWVNENFEVQGENGHNSGPM